MARVLLPCQAVRPLEESRAGLVRTRVARMMAAWLALGAIVGIGTGTMAGGQAAMILSNALAGMILFPPVGLLLGLIGGRARESFIGAAVGAILGTALGMIVGPAGVLNTATHALLVGALAGATFRPYLTLVRWVYSALQTAAGFTLRLAGRLT